MKYLSNRTVAKIVSVFIAILTWMYVISVEDPQTEISFRHIPITIRGEDKLPADLQVIYWGDDVVNVRVSGRRSGIASLTSKDIEATIDVSDIIASGEYMLDVDVDVNVDGVSVKRADIKSTKVNVDVYKSAAHSVVVKPNGIPKENFSVGDISCSTEEIVIKGPSMIVNKIAEATVDISVDDANSRITQICPIKIYQIDGSQMNEKDSQYLSLSADEVTVTIDFLREQSLNIQPAYAKTYNLSGYNVTVTPESVKVITEHDFEGVIKTEPITLYDSELSSGETFTKKIKLDIPAGVETKQEIDTVTVEFKHK